MITINNNSDLNYEIIGNIIDQYINSGYIDTHYYGKNEYFNVKKGTKVYQVNVNYGKNRIRYDIREVKIS